ncbi:MAG: tandem-95 repeat protein [Acidimicrobiia bacterium]|nr:tandem-95 repeat protein [Acidimicrobiia bacterium]
MGIPPVAGWIDAVEAAPFSVTALVTNGTDDAEEAASGSMTLGSSDLELTEETSTQTVGIRYSSLAIPKGAQITSAYLQFRSDEAHSGPTNLTIAVQAADNPGTFTTTPGNISARLRASLTASWAPPAWTATGQTGPAQATPDLSGVVQQVIDRPGWVAGNALVFVITGTGKRVADSFEGGANNAPVLHVEYGSGSANLPPIVKARADSTFLSGSATLDGNVIDDGVTGVITTWSKVSGPGEVNFTDPAAVDTTATFDQAGSYVLQLTADDGESIVSDLAPVMAVDGSAGQPGSVRFGLVGDLGDGNPNEAAVAQLISGLGPEFIITLGDNSYGPAGQDANVGKNYAAYMGNYDGAFGQGSALNRFFPALGNHDIEDGGGLADYLDYYTLPGGGIVSSNTSGNERYYDIVQGPVHIFFLDTDPSEPDGNTASSVQAAWLQAQLAVSTSPWNIVVAHDPPFASNGSVSASRWPFQEWGADVVLSGDAHLYERLEVNGFPYIIGGLGGDSRKAMPVQIPESQVIYNASYGGMIAEACTSGVTFQFHSLADGIIDTFTLGTACGSLPAPTDLGATATEGTIDLVWTDANGGTVGHEIERSDAGASGPFSLLATVPAGSVTYQDGGLPGTTEYCYRVRASGASEVSGYSNVSCATTPQPNSAPVANDDTAQTTQNTLVNIPVLANDSDVDGNLNPASVTITAGPTGGTAVPQPDGTVNYTPTSGFLGQGTFSYQVCDVALLCATANVTVSVGALNAPPTAGDVAASTDEDVTGSWTPSVSDSDSSNLTCLITIQPTVGTASVPSNCSAGSYVPPANFNGFTSFTYQVSDGVSTDTGLVSMTVRSVADAPQAVADGALAAAGVTIQVNVTANDTDVDLDLNPASVTIVTPPSNGSASVTGAGIISYTSAAGFSGSVQITYRVCDLSALCDTAILTIDVTNAPTVVERRVINGNDDNEEIPAGATRIGSSDLEFVLDGTTVQTVGIRFQNLTVPQGMTISSAYLKFQVDEASSEPTNLMIKAQATDNATAFTSASFDVSSRPVLAPSVAWVPPAWPTVGVSGPDQTSTDISALVQAVVNRPGWASGNSIAFTITGTGKRVAESYNGSVSAAPLLHVEYVSSGPAGSSPVVNTDLATTLEDTVATISVLANDSDPDGDLVASSVTIVSNGTKGTAVPNVNGTVTYTPNPNANGSDSFTYRVCDSGNRCGQALVSVTITSVADAPVAANDSASTTGTTSVVINVTGNDTDVDGDLNVGSVTIVTTPLKGIATPGFGTVMYTPNPSVSGSDSFTYRVCDFTNPTPLCATAVVSITIATVNNPPTAGPVSISGAEDNAIGWTPVVSDDAVTSISCSISTPAAKGTASVPSNCGSGNYIPNPNSNGSDSFAYTVSDGVSIASATVSVIVNPVADAPVAVNDSATTFKNSAVTIAVTANDSDPEGDLDPGSVSIPQAPLHGAVVVVGGGSVRYTPATGYVGADSFTYRVCDATTPIPLCSVATISVTVTDTSFTIDVRVSSSDDDNEERPNGTSRIGSSDLEMTDDGGPQIVGIRFQNLQIPRNSIITKAYIQFQVDEASAGPANLSLQVQDHMNGLAFSNTRFDMSSRTWSTQTVSWIPADWNSVGAVGPDQRTADIKDLVQLLVNNPEWVNGNAGVFLITGTGKRVAESSDGTASGAPLLHVEFSGPTASLGDSAGWLLLDSSITRT